ncbi:M48 family metallopeptidase [Clostridium felsineum]|uniref:Protease HtpX n=1 Tax=Clostridium felsineum TaxID=36839 RepID=A0A1S8L1W1_9CLOT|nr:M48 family metallopeptidase [Clostridium felsineum]URZ05278.1 Protease HtpX [Clostridium felsineum]URZ10319.1 Protease HtpX [Clostridium felsineum]
MSKKKTNIIFLICISVVIFFVRLKSGPMANYYHVMLTNDAIRMRYYKINVMLEIIYTIMGIVVPLLIIFSRIHVSLEKFSYKNRKVCLPGICIYLFLFVIVDHIFYLPLDIYSGFINDHIFALSNQSFGKWAFNWSINVLTTAFFLALVLWIPYKLAKKSPKRWWLYTWVIFIPIIIFSYIISPIVIDPMYNKFEPIKDKKLENKIQNLAHRAGVYNCQLYQVNKSADTKQINAYMTGALNTKRIVIWDTAIKNLSERELEFVVSHEMGHYVLHHNTINCFGTIGGLFIMLYIIHKITPYIIEKRSSLLRIDSISDVKSLPLIMLIIFICTAISDPVYNAASRKMEYSADTFAIELTRDNAAGVSLFKKLSVKNLSITEPDKWYEIWKYTHPSLKERIDFVNSYKPWNQNKPLKYSKYIK